MNKNNKILGRRNYGSIPHLPGSRLGSGDHHCHEGQARIATVKTRNKHEEVIVQEKLDGSNVGVARVNDVIFPIGRAGYLASTSPYEQHRQFSRWAYSNTDRFMSVLKNGQRVAGEWLMMAHGTRYDLAHEPFVAFDIMSGAKRLPYDAFIYEINDLFITPHLLWRGGSFTIEQAVTALGKSGFHGACELPEGAVWRVENNKSAGIRGARLKVVNFLVKYVRPDKKDGKYLSNISGLPDVWHWRP